MVGLHYIRVSLNLIVKNNKINLFIASYDGHERTVKLLIEAGGDLTQVSFLS